MSRPGGSLEAALVELVAEAVAGQLEPLLDAVAELRAAVAGPAAPPPLLDRKAAAEWARCSVGTVDGWIRDGAPVVRLGGPGGSPRFEPGELLRWLRSRAEAPSGENHEGETAVPKLACLNSGGESKDSNGLGHESAGLASRRSNVPSGVKHVP